MLLRVGPLLQLLQLVLCQLPWRPVLGDGRLDMETELVAEWNILDYKWTKGDTRQAYIDDGRLIQENLHISGLAADKQNVFLTVPRMKSKDGVPWSVNSIPKSYSERRELKPFPEPEFTKSSEVGDCERPQNPLALELHHDTNLLYVLDTGTVGVLSDSPDTKCPPKIMSYYTKSGTSTTYLLDTSIVQPEKSVLVSLVLDFTRSDHRPRLPKFIYIADNGMNQLVVYDVDNDKTWSFKYNSIQDSSYPVININGESVNVGSGINSLAMSPDFNYLYYTTASSRELYQVPTWVLRKPTSNFTSNVRFVGDLVSDTAGMYHGVDALYYTALEEDAVYRWDTRHDVIEQKVHEGKVKIKSQVPIVHNYDTMQWPHAVALDPKGNLYFTTTKSHLYYSDKIDFSEKNTNHFRVYRVKLGDKSYVDDDLPDDDFF